MKRSIIAISGISLGFLSPFLHADTVITSDGAKLVGKIKAISESSITLETQYAGNLEVKRENIVSFTTDEPLNVRLDGGSTVAGTVSKMEDGSLAVDGQDANVVTSVKSVTEAWQPADKDPAIVRIELENAKLARHWKNSISVDFLKKTGNTDRETIGAYIDSVMEGPNDTLNLYGHYIYGKENGEKTDDETIGGVRYSNYFYKYLGWYVRTELERDPFEDIRIRSTSGAGLSLRVINEELHKTVVNLGIAYRYESYTTNADDEGKVGLDVVITDDWTITSWLRESTKIEFVPAFDDFNDYLLRQDTGFEMPLAMSKVWMVRLGISNDYNNRPQPGREHLDTTYYARLMLKW